MFPRLEARSHLEALERKHGIEVRIVHDWRDGEANVTTRQIWVPDPTTPLRYMIALHEFGHVLDKISGKVMLHERPECEAAAWKWAIRHARPNLLDHLTTRDWNTIGRCWLTVLTNRVSVH